MSLTIIIAIIFAAAICILGCYVRNLIEEADSLNNDIESLHILHDANVNEIESLKKALSIACEDANKKAEKELAEIALRDRRNQFCELRRQGYSVKDSGNAIGVSITTAKRYENYRKSNCKQ